MLNPIKRPRISVPDGDGPPRYPVKDACGRLRSVIYHGHKVECSCCGRSFSLFLWSPYMTALCPNCLSMERYRLLCRFLVEETDFGTQPIRMLDVAPTYAFQEFCRRFPMVDYLSIDLQSDLAMKHMDLTALDLESDMFDFLTCYHVFEHIDDDLAAARELYRVMKPGGWGIIQVPILIKKTVQRHELSEAEAERILKFDDHVRGYGKDFPELLAKAGFQVEVVEYAGAFDEDERKRYGIDAREDLHVCRKPAGEQN
jgi:SAM-dependent methyltransferase